MENASKALIIAGAILLSILIIAIGMFIYNSSQNAIMGGADAISSQERDAFNAVWEQYDESQQGSNVKTLISRLITNAKTYEEEASKLPTLTYDGSASGGAGKGGSAEGGEAAQGDITDYVAALNEARTNTEARHTYTVEIVYSPVSSLIEEIIVRY